MPQRINGGYAAGMPKQPNHSENDGDPSDGHYHYPGKGEDGYSGNTGRAVEPNRAESAQEVPQNHDTVNYTRYLK